MATLVLFNSFTAAVMNGEHDLASNTLKIALTNTAPDVATDVGLADITEITAEHGYVAGGQALGNVTSTQTAGVYTLEADDEVFTASEGAMGEFQYGVLYDDTSTGDLLIGYWDKESKINLATGETCTFDFTDGVVITWDLTP